MSGIYKDITERFLRGRFGLKTRIVFNSLFSMESSPVDESEKESTVLAYWNECLNTKPTSDTLSDYKKLLCSLGLGEIEIDKRKTLFYRIAYVVASLIGIIASWYISDSTHPKDETAYQMSSFSTKSGEVGSFKLPDSSIVWVNGGSIVLYPEHFSETKRIVYLTGEARFDIVKDPSRPFVVKTHEIDVTALGTVFNVRAFPYEKVATAYLETGKIQCSLGIDKDQQVYLDPNEILTLNCIDGTFNVSMSDSRGNSPWWEGYLVFEDADISTIISSIEMKYGVEIIHASKQDNTGKYNIVYSPDESIDEVLEVLSMLTNTGYTREGNKYIFN